MLTSSEVVGAPKLGKRARPSGMMHLQLWSGSTTNLVAPCLAACTEHVSFTERTQVNISPGPRIWARGITHCNYCDEPGDGLRAALSYLVNPKADLRQLPRTLQHLITNRSRPTRNHPSTPQSWLQAGRLRHLSVAADVWMRRARMTKVPSWSTIRRARARC